MHYGQFCPVSKAAEVFAEKWTPLILRELCYGPKVFGELLFANPLISRTVLAQRLKELARAGVIEVEAKEKGKGSVYRLSPAGEDFRPIIALMSRWGQRWAQARVTAEDLDPKLILWALARQIDPEAMPQAPFVVRFEWRGIPKGAGSQRYWWLVLRDGKFDVCLKAPGWNEDVVIAADLGAFTRAWLGYVSVEEMLERGRIAFHGEPRAVALMRSLLHLPEQARMRSIRFAPFAESSASMNGRSA